MLTKVHRNEKVVVENSTTFYTYLIKQHEIESEESIFGLGVTDARKERFYVMDNEAATVLPRKKSDDTLFAFDFKLSLD